MPKKPDLMLQLPPVDQADFETMKRVMIDTLRHIVHAGYHPGYAARAMIIAGTTALHDLGGEEGTIEYLEKLTHNLRLGGRPVGNA